MKNKFQKYLFQNVPSSTIVTGNSPNVHQQRKKTNKKKQVMAYLHNALLPTQHEKNELLMPGWIPATCGVKEVRMLQYMLCESTHMKLETTKLISSDGKQQRQCLLGGGLLGRPRGLPRLMKMLLILTGCGVHSVYLFVRTVQLRFMLAVDKIFLECV